MGTVKDWFEENCRPSGNNKLVCEKDGGVVAIDPLEGQDFSEPATEDNVEEFLDRNKAVDVERQGA